MPLPKKNRNKKTGAHHTQHRAPVPKQNVIKKNMKKKFPRWRNALSSFARFSSTTCRSMSGFCLAKRASRYQPTSASTACLVPFFLDMYTDIHTDSPWLYHWFTTSRHKLISASTASLGSTHVYTHMYLGTHIYIYSTYTYTYVQRRYTCLPAFLLHMYILTLRLSLTWLLILMLRAAWLAFYRQSGWLD